MSYAVIELGGNQYKVSPGEDFVVALVGGQPGEIVEVDRVLMLVEDGKVTVGAPTIVGKKFKAKIVSQDKGVKIKVAKYKAKSRYQKEIGFRAKMTRLRIDTFESIQKREKVSTSPKTAGRKSK